MQAFYDACPLCDCEMETWRGEVEIKSHRLWHDGLPEKMQWIRCRDCGHVFTEHYWEPACLGDVLKNAHDYQTGSVDPERNRLMWAPAVRAVAELMPPPGRWLDVGCGDGGLVMVAHEWGYDAEGIDVRPAAVEAVTRYGYKATVTTLDAMRGHDDFIVISMCDLLEHVPFPRQQLEWAHELMQPGGMLLVSCPNADCVTWRALDAHQRNPYWKEFEHHHNFTRARLMSLLRECGFEAVSYDVSSRYKASMQIIAEKV